MDIIRTLRGPANAIRVSKRGQTIQMERVAAVCKVPKARNKEVVYSRGYDNWKVAGCALEPFWRGMKM